MQKFIMGAALAAFAFASTPAMADENADKAIKFRQGVMDAIGAAAGGLAAGVKGDEAYKAVAAELGAMLAASANAGITGLAFSMNTTGQSEVRSTALPKVWDDHEDFTARLQQLSERAAAVAAAGADVSGTELGPLFETCKGCHETYRQR